MNITETTQILKCLITNDNVFILIPHDPFVLLVTNKNRKNLLLFYAWDDGSCEWEDDRGAIRYELNHIIQKDGHVVISRRRFIELVSKYLKIP